MDTGGLPDRGQHEELGDEATQRRKPDKAEQADGHHHAQPRTLALQSPVIGDLLAVGPVADQCHDCERAEVHEQVDRQVEQYALDTVGREHLVAILERDEHGDDAGQHVTGVGDCRIGEHPLDVGLKVGGQVAEGRTDHGDHAQADRQRHRQVAETCQLVNHPDQQGKRGGLGGDREESADFGRSSLERVRTPEVEGDQGELEGQADQDHHHTQHDRADSGG